MTAATAVAGCCIWRSSVRMPPPSAWSRGARPSAVLRLHFHTVHGGGRDRHDAVQPAARPWPGPPVHVGAAGRHRDRRAAGSAGDLRFQGGLQGVAWAGGRLATMLLGGWLVFGRHRLVRWPTRGELRPALAAIGRIAAPAALTGHAGGGDLRRVHLCRLWLQRDGRRHGHGPGAATGLFDVLRAARRDRADPGQNLGAGNWDRIRETARLTARLALAYGLGMAVLLALLAPFIADLFKVTGPGRDLVVFFCRYASFIWVLNSFSSWPWRYSTTWATPATPPPSAGCAPPWAPCRWSGWAPAWADPRAWCWVSRPVSRCSAWWRWRCAGACCAGLLPGRRRLPPDSHRRLDFIIGTRYDRG